MSSKIREPLLAAMLAISCASGQAAHRAPDGTPAFDPGTRAAATAAALPPPLPRPGACAPARAVLYPTLPGAPASTTYSITVDGQPVFVEKFGAISYARFALCGQVAVTVTAPEPIASHAVRPRSYGIAASAADRTLSFNLAGPAPRYVWVTVNKLEKLFILVDAPEENPPRPGQPRVYDVATYAGVDPTGARSTTAALQAAIDDVAGKGGGTLYFGDGRYKTGTLLVRSGVFLYLSAGALIDGSGVIAEYRQDYGGQSYQIGFVKVKNAGLIGRGTVDAAGQHLRRTYGDPKSPNGFTSSKGNVVKPVLSQDLVIRGVVLRNPPSFASRISDCDGVVFDQVKVLAHVDQTNTDGLDPDSSRNVVIANSFGYNGDDCVSVKTSGNGVPPRASHGIRISGNVFWTMKVAFRIGGETRADIRDVLIEDNDVIHADRGVGLYVYESGAVSNIKWIGNRLEVIADDMKRALIYCDLKRGSVSDILIKDLACESFSEKQSHISAGFDGLVIENMTVAGKQVTTAAEARISSASKIEFR